jgi:hypothetical protein
MTIQSIYNGADGNQWAELVWFDEKNKPMNETYRISSLAPDDKDPGFA